MGRRINPSEKFLIVGGRDLYLNVGRVQLAEFLIGKTITTPKYIAVGTKVTAAADPRTLDALEDELDREAITSFYREEYTAKFVAVFTRKRAVGDWRELGLFDSDARVVTLSSCDDLTNWTSENTLSVEITDYRQGAGALEASGSATLDFRNAALAPDYGTFAFSTEDKLQLWYYVDSVANLADAVTIEVSSSTTDDTDEFQFSIPKAELTDGWNWISKRISEAAIIGTPDLNAIVRFRLYVAKTANVVTRIDCIRYDAWSHAFWDWRGRRACLDAKHRCRLTLYGYS